MRLRARHPREILPAEARRLQERMRRRLDDNGRPEADPRRIALRAPFPLERFRENGIVVALDVAYRAADRMCFGAAVVWDVRARRAIARFWHPSPAVFPYVPGLLAFREIPALIPVLARIRTPAGHPVLLLCDGQGIAHPRRFGLAVHLGFLYGVPSIGWAKTLYVGSHEDPAPGPSAHPSGASSFPDPPPASPLLDRGEQVGWAIRARPGTRPTYLSPGFGVSLGEALSIAAILLESAEAPRRLPEPARLAHALSGEAMRATAVAR